MITLKWTMNMIDEFDMLTVDMFDTMNGAEALEDCLPELTQQAIAEYRRLMELDNEESGDA